MHSIAKAESLREGFVNLNIQEQKLAKEFLRPFANSDKKVLVESFSIKQLV
jgi:hypothetical protein